MKPATKPCFLVSLVATSLLLAACSGVKPSSLGSGTGSTATPTVGGTVTGLTGTGLVLQNNSGDDLIITANGAFKFKTALVSGKAYNVSVVTPPSSPAQTCTVTAGSGIATGNVTSVVVTCTTGTVAIGVTVAGLTGVGLVLQNGTDFLTITGTTTTTQFKTAIPFGQPYNVTVSTQPTTPAQTCGVTGGGSGNATAGVAVNVQVTCSLGTLSLGGSVSGYAGGAGFVLQNNGGDSLTIAKNGAFTFPTLIPLNGAYKVTVSAQPSGPNQSCAVSLGSGTATANVTNVSVVCPAVFHPIDVSVVGVLGTTGSMQLLNNGGDNLKTPKNGSYTFATQIAHASQYDVNEFVAPAQPEGCIVWGFSGIALTTPVNPIPVVDCGHDDWTWMAGTNSTDQFGKTPAPPPPPTTPPTPPPPPPTCPPANTDTPGGSNYSAAWTDRSGNLWLLTGDGFTSTSPPPGNLPGFFNELWVFTGTANYGGSCGNIWALVKPAAGTPAGRWGAVTWTDPGTGNLMLFGGQDGSLAFLNDLWSYTIATKTWTQLTPLGGGNVPGHYGAPGDALNLPGGRWGASARLDASGTVWLFGGFGCDSTGGSSSCSNLLLNDLWKYSGGAWTWVSGANTGNQAGVYGTLGTPAAANVPPGRQASVAWIDSLGNFWMFGGFTSGTNGFNDLWKYDPVAKQWTWVSGSKGATSTPGNYGTQGIAAASNVPGARWIPAAWSDTHGNLWLFGGEGFDTTGNGSLGDLWEFTLDTTTDAGNPAQLALNQWTWIKGPNAVSQQGLYGIQPSPTVWPHVVDFPGSRWGAAYWTTTPSQTGEQQFWMFGGEGFDATGSSGKGFNLLNDLWRYLPYP
jgi:hypothetical protein